MIESDLEQAGSFSSSDNDLNAISGINAYTFRCLDAGGYYVDCPHRERLGYGDGQVAVETGIYNFNLENFYKKWAGNWHNAQGPDGSIPNTAPSPYSAGGGPGWGGTGVVLPWKIFKYYADTAFLASSWEAMAGYVGFLESKMKDGLIAHYGDPKWGFIGDWVAPGRGMDSGNPPEEEDKELFNNCYLLYLYDILYKAAEVLGKEAEGDICIKKGEKLRALINERYYDPANGIYANGEQSYLVFPLLMDVPGDQDYERVLSNLVKTIEVTDEGHLNTGMLGTYFMLQYLTEIGRSDLVYLMMKQKTYPGWGYMLEEGANTCWEQWNGYWSNIHSCFTSGGGWFFTGVAGIGQKDNSTAFRHLLLRPQLTDRIDSQESWFESPYGKVVLEWERKENGELIINVEVPANSFAELVLPAGANMVIKESGRPVEGNGDVEIVSRDRVSTVLSLKSGIYNFEMSSILPLVSGGAGG
jgi:alpha-L-rhamnosidase